MDINVNIIEQPINATITEQVIKAELPPNALIREISGVLEEELLLGVINGINTEFHTTQIYAPGSTQVYVNGLTQEQGVSYYENGGTEINFTTPPSNLGMTDKLLIRYKRQ